MELTTKELNDLMFLIGPAVEAYRLGRAAAEGTQSLQDCPYGSNTIERKAWMHGYFAVREETNA